MKSYVLGEFAGEAALVTAARLLREQGETGLDAHSPVPVHGIEEALGLKRSAVPLIALVGALVGTASGIAMQWWMNAVDYPINVGGRAMISPLTWVPIAFETTVALAAISIVAGLFALGGLPRLHHPVFEVEGFRTASVDGFWLSAEVEPARAEAVAESLRKLGAKKVARVDEEAP